jgi:hypothetical protein
MLYFKFVVQALLLSISAQALLLQKVIFDINYFVNGNDSL